MRRSATLMLVLALLMVMAAPAASAGGPSPKANGHQTFTPGDTGSCPSGTWNVTFNVQEKKDGFSGFFKWTEGDPAVTYSWALVPDSVMFFEADATYEYDQVWFNVAYEPNGSTLDLSMQCLYLLSDGARSGRDRPR